MPSSIFASQGLRSALLKMSRADRNPWLAKMAQQYNVVCMDIVYAVTLWCSIRFGTNIWMVVKNLDDDVKLYWQCISLVRQKSLKIHSIGLIFFFFLQIPWCGIPKIAHPSPLKWPAIHIYNIRLKIIQKLPLYNGGKHQRDTNVCV